jgi:hypothetical protein
VFGCMLVGSHGETNSARLIACMGGLASPA